MRRTIVHIIESLERGGAETLLAGVVASLVDYEHIIITLRRRNDFQEELRNIKIIQFDFNGYRSIPKLIVQLRQLFRTWNKEIIVHAHMFWANIISRLAVPRHIPLLNSYHSVSYGPDGANYPAHAILLDKLTYKKRPVTTLCVSQEVRRNVATYVGIKKNVFVLYNYIENIFYQRARPAVASSGKLRIVAVGNLKKQKNYKTIVSAFTLLKARLDSRLYSLDIYGQGPLLEELRQQIASAGIENITFKGSVSNVADCLPAYDLYLLSSSYEGFGIAVIEAMAVGLPLMLSDIAVLREVTEGNAIFFNCQSPEDLAVKIEHVIGGHVDLSELSRNGMAKAEEYRKDAYLKKLCRIYDSVSIAVNQV